MRLLRSRMLHVVDDSLPDCARCTPASIISSPDNPRWQVCYIVIVQTMCCPASIISSPDNPRWQVCYIVIVQTMCCLEASLWWGSAVCYQFTVIVFGRTCRHRGHLLVLPFSEDCCTRDQRRLFPMLSKWKIILIHLLAKGGGGGVTGSGLRCYKYSYITSLQGIYLTKYPLEHVI